MTLKKNDYLNLSVTDLTNLGFGVARHDGAVIFISSVVPGDEVRAKIIKVTKSYAVARVEEYIKRSDERTDKRCSIKACASCAYKHVEYECELEMKRRSVAQSFKKAGLDSIAVAPIIASPETAHYRNKAQYPISKDTSGRCVIGFYAPKTHRVTEAALCPMAPESFCEILETVRSFVDLYGISVYDEESGNGLLRHVYLRGAETTSEILLTLVINGDALPFSEEFCKLVNEKHPEVVGILLNVNKDLTNIVLGKKFAVLYGVDYITDTLAGVKLRVTAPSFYQVNRKCTEVLYGKARELAELTNEDTLLDVYCGAGSIGLSMARNVKELIGIEIVESAVECAKFNAKENGIENAHFFTADAKDTEKMLQRAETSLGRKITPTVVILDPPRAGCDEALIGYVASLSPKRVVYISCNPTTLARDVVLFGELGYTCNEVTPVDMFPGTGHVESLVCLTKQTN